MRFDANNKVGAVSCAVHTNHADWIRSVKFMDEYDKVLHEYGHQC